ncbi:MAG: hypothetical protein AVDCRST_MAG18-1401, partial [uncultured Thermomicrobiales bacterium]
GPAPWRSGAGCCGARHRPGDCGHRARRRHPARARPGTVADAPHGHLRLGYVRLRHHPGLGGNRSSRLPPRARFGASAKSGGERWRQWAV